MAKFIGTIELSFCICAVLSIVSPARACSDTIEAASCSQPSVQAAIDIASDGDIVLVPAGSAQWSTPVTCTKGLDIRGAGIDQTIIYDKTSGAYLQEPLVCTTKTGYTTKVSGFTFDGTDSAPSSAGMVLMKASSYNAGTFRVHHCSFRNMKVRGVGVYTVYGLVDNNTFTAPWNLNGQGVSFWGDDATAWTRALTLGTANAVYIEDNIFNYTYMNDGAFDAYSGARVVFRYNTVINTPLGWHGCDTGNYRSTHSFEVYNNQFTTSVNTGGRAILSRGGTGVIYNNTFVGSLYRRLELANYRSCTDPDGKNWGIWGMCNGVNPIDGNIDSTGYNSQDQCGWTSTGLDDGTGPKQILSPIYAWGNTLDGSSVGLTVVNTCSQVSVHIKENRDFYNGVQRPGYSPYTYPHPLRSGGDGTPQSPTGLRLGK
jgi:hypothetical protein